MTGYIFWTAVCLCLGAFFSAAEAACREAGTALSMRLCRLLSNAVCAGLAAVLALRLGSGWYIAPVSLAAVICNAVSAAAAGKNADAFAAAASPVIRVFAVITLPLARLASGLSRLAARHTRGEEEPPEEDAAVEELQSIIETVEDEGVIDEERSDLLQAALDFSEISASEVMTSRVDMEALDIEDSREELFAAIEASPHSRIPFYEGSVDDIIGVLHLNRFYRALLEDGQADIRPMLIEPCFVYKTMKLPAVLAAFRRAQTHLAIVTDEYGGAMGVITMEDVCEQIVGDIWDETDEIEAEIVERGGGRYELDGDMSMSDFTELIEDELSGEIPESESSTVGGWAIEMTGSFPAPGDSFRVGKLRITVLEMDEDGRRVERVLAEPAPDSPEE